MLLSRFFTILLLVVCSFFANYELFSQTDPCGLAAVTCFSGQRTGGGQVTSFPDRDVMAIKDVRNRTGIIPSNSDQSSLFPTISDPTWNARNMGEVFGLAVDPIGLIFVASTTIYGDDYFGDDPMNTGGEIYVVDVFGNPTPQLLVRLPNNGQGLGNVAYARLPNGQRKLYATNSMTGRIYTIDLDAYAGNALTSSDYTVTDPFQPYDGLLDYAPMGELLWGIQFNKIEQRVYFGRWTQNYGNVGSPNNCNPDECGDVTPNFGLGPNEVYSYAVDNSGIPVGAAQLEVVIPLRHRTSADPNAPMISNPVSDIAFSSNNEMLISERSMCCPDEGGAHRAAIIRYEGGMGNWGATDEDRYFVGGFFNPPSTNPNNSAGGVAFGPASFIPGDDDIVCDELVWTTADAGPTAYGLMGIPFIGNSASVPNAYYIDITPNQSVQVEKRLIGDVEIFACDCTTPSTCPATVTNTTEDDCCPTLDYANPSGETVYGLGFTLLDGVTFHPNSTTFPASYIDPVTSPSTRVLAQNSLEPLPENIPGVLDFCMLNVEAPQQRLVVNYLDQDLMTPLCSDTLFLNCPVPNYCLEVTADTLICDPEGDGYRLQINGFVPPNNETEDVGLIKIHLPDQAPLRYVFTPPLTSGDIFSIDTLLPSLPILPADTLKIGISAHDGLEERLCCFVDSLCLAVPLCEPACPFSPLVIEASNGQEGQEDLCCYMILVDIYSPAPDYYTELSVRLFHQFTGAPEITPQNYPGWTFTNTVQDASNTEVLFTGETAQLSQGLLPIVEVCFNTPDNETTLVADVLLFNPDEGDFCTTQTDVTTICEPTPSPCDSLSSTALPSAEPCTYDLFLDNNFASNPDLVTSITVSIIGGPADNFAGHSLLPTAPGWSTTTLNNGTYTLNPTSGAMPLGADQQVFSFTVEASSSPDSTYVEVAFLSGMDTLCRDTVAAICPSCLTVDQETTVCLEMSQAYFFTWYNHSPYPVNAVRILETEGNDTDILLNGQTHYLGEMVPVGGAFVGSIPVEFIDDGDGEFCFDVVLRQVVEGEVPINCCFTTICAEVADCSPEDAVDCQPFDANETPDCPLDYQPVCGCDGRTYTNRCFVTEAGLVNWYGGPCPNTPPTLPNFPINDRDIFDDRVILTTPAPLPPGELPDWYGYILQRFRPSDNTWWQIDAAFEIGGELISLEDNGPIPGAQTYRIIAVTPTGQPYLSEEATVDVPAMRVNLTLSPNPAADFVWLSSEHQGPASVELISTNGRYGPARKIAFDGSPIHIDLSQQPAGVHTLMVRFADGRWGSKRVVVR